MSVSWRAIADSMLSRLLSHKRVELSTSVNRNVTVPVGKAGVTTAESLHHSAAGLDAYPTVQVPALSSETRVEHGRWPPENQCSIINRVVAVARRASSW